MTSPTLREDAVRGGSAGSVGDVIGIPASGGLARGPARVVHSLDEFERVQAGAILVCPITAPAWTPLFESSAGS